jgi:hypothetical protein
MGGTLSSDTLPQIDPGNDVRPRATASVAGGGLAGMEHDGAESGRMPVRKRLGTGKLLPRDERASKPHAELPLHLFAGTPDRPDDAATLVVQETLRR